MGKMVSTWSWLHFIIPTIGLNLTAARSFRDRIESTSDLILTGHEHIASMKVQDGNLGATQRLR